MPTEQERRALEQALGSYDQLQARLREGIERDPARVYAELLTEQQVPVAYLLHRSSKIEKGAKARSHRFVLILDQPDEAVLVRAFKIEVGVTRMCLGQDIGFEVRKAYSGTKKDVEGLIQTGYAIVQVTGQDKPES